LAGELLDVIRRGVREPLSDCAFNELALRVFRFQCRANRAYGGFVARRRVDPDSVVRWEEIPFLPTRAFKAAALVSGDPGEVERVFRTSGTSMGQERRGEHHVLDLALYRASLLPNFEAHLLPEHSSMLTVLCLLPPPETVSDSSLSFMMGEVVTAFGSEGSGFFASADGGVDTEGFRGSLRAAETAGGPVLVAGTAFAFVRWTELALEHRWQVVLPEGSRIMETGGYKGRTRELRRKGLYDALESAFGVPLGSIVNEYGMTELLSQFYEPVLSGSPGYRGAGPTDGTGVSGGRGGLGCPGLGNRFHHGPPWVRTRVLNPLTLAPVLSGEAGVLAHLDLANLGSVAAVLTDDLGRQVPGGFQLLGRSPGSEPRGCSLAMEDFLASQAVES
jgi:hypothetical protein